MDTLILFTDGSVHPQLKLGFGAYLLIREQELDASALESRVKLKRFDSTSSTKLELQTLLWALSEMPASDEKIIVYTDSQNIVGLPDRRLHLEQNDYCSKSGNPLRNGELYRSFFQVYDQFNCHLTKVEGHLPGRQKEAIEHCFTLVDRASRKALREAVI